MSRQLDTDYLVVGAGATALAFVDTILDETDADVVMVDRYDKPGGHWRVAYDFVRLHQPSNFYGVNSRPLGKEVIESEGYNAGYLELANVDEIRDYFEKVVAENFLPSGRVRYFPNSEYLGDGKVARVLAGDVLEFQARRRIVDTTHTNVTVPSVTTPSFEVSGDVQVVPPNGLSRLRRAHDRYVVLGGGKTGIDTVLWLLGRDTPADRISWVIPRDAWFENRAHLQPGPEFTELCDGFIEAYFGAWLEASSVDELLNGLVAAEFLFRLSDEVRPTSFRCATITRAELDAIRTVDDVVRLGRVQAIDQAGVTLEQGAREFGDDVLYVDCTADGLRAVDPVPVFQPGLITIQSVTACQPAYGAAFIAYVESRSDDDETKNSLTAPLPHPYHDADIVRLLLEEFRNELRWSEDPEIVQWRYEARLSGAATRVGTPLPPAGPEREEFLAVARETLVAAIAKGEELLKGAEASDRPMSIRG